MRENDAREGGDDLCLAKKLVSTELNPGASETPKLTLDRLRDVLNPPFCQDMGWHTSACGSWVTAQAACKSYLSSG